MKSKLLSLLTLLLCAGWHSVANAQIRGNEYSVVVSPDHKDWNYKLGETCEFTVAVYDAQNLKDNVVVDYELGPVMYPDVKKQQVTLKNGTIKLRGKMTVPGFYRCKVWAHIGSSTYEGLATAGYAPEKIEPASKMPADFKQYWADCIAQARQTQLEPRMTLLPERCTDLVNTYEVSFQNDRYGARMYGILCVPKAEGRYPALLRVPGAGVRPYEGDTWTASKGAITLEIGIHGIPVTMQQDVYDKLAASALRDYWWTGIDNPQQCYYRHVITGMIRAIDFIDQLPQYNHSALGVTGSSQGGALSVIAAALDSRVTFYAAVHPALCDHEAFLSHRAGGWPHYYYNTTPSQQTIDNIRHYDTVNFARLISVPGWFSWGYNDEVCPPTSTQAAYNVITAPKELHPYLQTGHYWYQEQWDEWCQWLWNKMGIK